MDSTAETKRLLLALQSSEKIQAELDKTVFSLKTLHDISTDIFSSIETENIMHNFLLMCMGNFGSKRGFLMLMNLSDDKFDRDTSLGYRDEELGPLRKLGEIIAKREGRKTRIFSIKGLGLKAPIPFKVRLVSTFFFEPHWQGVLILDDKLIESGYSADDREMLQTLINTLLISLRNAKFYEEVWNLNQELDAKNTELGNALEDLKASLRKIELLESIKDNLNKFVPQAVSRAIEKSPTGHNAR